MPPRRAARRRGTPAPDACRRGRSRGTSSASLRRKIRGRRGTCRARMDPITDQALLPMAGVTDVIVDPIVEVSVDVIDAMGYAGVFVLMLLESACIPVPSEAIMLFAGFNVSAGDMTLFGIVAAGVLGNVVGSWVAWWAGYYGRIELLEKNRLIHLNPKHLAWADSWFERHGDATV